MWLQLYNFILSILQLHHCYIYGEIHASLVTYILNWVSNVNIELSPQSPNIIQIDNNQKTNKYLIVILTKQLKVFVIDYRKSSY